MTLTIDKMYGKDNKLTGVLIKIPAQDPQLTAREVMENVVIYINYPLSIYYCMSEDKTELYIIAYKMYIQISGNDRLIPWNSLIVNDLLSKHK